MAAEPYDNPGAAGTGAQAADGRDPAQALLARHMERFRLLHEMDQAILGARSPEAIALGALTRIRHLIPCERAFVAVFDGTGVATLLAVVASPDFRGDLAGWLELLHGTVAPRPVVQGAADLLALPRHSPLQSRLSATQVRSYLIVPLVTQAGLLGTLNLEATQPDALTGEHVETAVGVAASLAIALEQAQLRASLQEELNERQLVEAALRARETALRQYAAELQAQNAELDAFAHTVAHDLKNPLTTALGFAELLAQHGPSLSAARAHDYARLIVENANKMAQIIDALLLLASVRKQEDVPMQLLDMGAIVAEVQKRLASLFGEYQGELIVPNGWPPACGYEPWVEQIWANYISNGLKYGGRPPRLEVGASVVAESPASDAAMVRFWVRDNGPGLSKEQQKRLFAPFTRLAEVRTLGHGLGLSIVQRLVDRLGGQVGVESQPGQGSLFYFTLPAPVTETVADQPKRRRGTSPLSPAATP